jgi:hypothetical protein
MNAARKSQQHYVLKCSDLDSDMYCWRRCQWLLRDVGQPQDTTASSMDSALVLHTHFDSVKPVSASITATWLSAATATSARLGVPAARLFVRTAKPSWRSLPHQTAGHAGQGA